MTFNPFDPFDFDWQTDVVVGLEQAFALKHAGAQTGEIAARMRAFGEACPPLDWPQRAIFHLLVCQIVQRAAGKVMAAHAPGSVGWIRAAEMQRDSGRFMEWLHLATNDGAFVRRISYSPASSS